MRRKRQELQKKHRSRETPVNKAHGRNGHPDRVDPLELSIAIAGARLLAARSRLPDNNDFIERLMVASGHLLAWSPYVLGELKPELAASRRSSLDEFTEDPDLEDPVLGSCANDEAAWREMLVGGRSDQL